MPNKPEVFRLGVMGGTFNPIHQGHLVTAEVVRDEFRLKEVIFVPSGKPPHKEDDIAPAQHRLMMVILATASNPYFSVSPIEVKRKGESYTRDTLIELKKMYGENSECFFITGADAIAQVSSWHKAEDLPSLAQFVAASRPGYTLDLKILPPSFRKCTYIIEVPALAISSTEIRRRIREKKTIKYLVPESVETYIYKNKLYHPP